MATPLSKGSGAPDGLKNPSFQRGLSLALWLVAFLLATLVIIVSLRSFASPGSAASVADNTTNKIPYSTPQGLSWTPQPFTLKNNVNSILRAADLHTSFPDRRLLEVRIYTVEQGDSVFEIARQFHLKPETVLWANYELLNDNPDMISQGMSLKIPPIDGVYYQWQSGDTIEGVAARFKAHPEDILNWPENKLDLVDPQMAPGKWILIPGGRREFRQWIIPTIARGHAGVSAAMYGGGACSGGYDGAVGSGSFVWPSAIHSISGNEYWDGHLAIDLAAAEGGAIYAADSGVVVFAGWATGGYGNTVMIDHGNGYQTLYAHLSAVRTSCGQSVRQGGVIGSAGSTGNSTGTHLHFEVRYQGGFINPLFVLPAP